MNLNMPTWTQPADLCSAAAVDESLSALTRQLAAVLAAVSPDAEPAMRQRFWHYANPLLERRLQFAGAS